MSKVSYFLKTWPCPGRAFLGHTLGRRWKGHRARGCLGQGRDLVTLRATSQYSGAEPAEGRGQGRVWRGNEALRTEELIFTVMLRSTF